MVVEEPAAEEVESEEVAAERLAEIRSAAAQGNVMAQYYLGAMYATGNGNVTPDYEEAALWYHKAAEQGLSMAQNNLGFLYATGQGVPLDYVTAYMWITLAIMGDYPDAANNLEILAKYMTPEMIELARQQAQDWQQEHGKG
ncbi:MAG: sel1 repeat family protein [Magnetococcales bacterium]|nr:sel1 repeat family protein [Magnetococcales bacterium]